MLDRDLAALYETETKALNLAVKRNAKRYPSDFMFQLIKDEFEALRSQFETSEKSDKHL
jgi:ORF6N domain